MTAVARISNEVAGSAGGSGCAAETHGEVLFSPSRPRPLCHRRVDLPGHAGRRVRAAPATTMSRIALDICRDLKVPIVPRGARHQPVRPDGGRRAGDRPLPSTCATSCDVDVERRTARRCEPGLVLDHLNARSRSTACGIRSTCPPARRPRWAAWPATTPAAAARIAYGNMVHNVLGAQAWLPTASLLDFGRFDAADRPRRADRRLRAGTGAPAPRRDRGALAQGAAPRRAATTWTSSTTRASGPTPRTARSTWRTCWSAAKARWRSRNRSTCSLSELPRAKVLGVVNFPTFYEAMDCGAAHRQARRNMQRGALTAVELVDRTMIELSLQNPAFAPTDPHRAAPIGGKPEAILLVEFSGERQGRARAQAQGTGRADGRAGPARQRGRDDRRRAAEEPVGSAQGGPQHHDEPARATASR